MAGNRPKVPLKISSGVTFTNVETQIRTVKFTESAPPSPSPPNTKVR